MSTTVSVRNSNIELARLVSILMVLVLHSNFLCLPVPTELSGSALLRLTLQALCIIGVDVFVFITGWYGTRPRRVSLARLLFICLFYGLIEIGLQFYFDTFSLRSLDILSFQSWFVADYLGLLCFTPVLNAFVASATRRQYQAVLLGLFLFQTWSDVLPGWNQDFLHGYSILSMMLLYLLARYARVHGLPTWIREKAGTLYLLCTAVIVLLACFFLLQGKAINRAYFYTSPWVILSAVACFFFFEKHPIRPSRFINHLAQSCLAILLIHTDSLYVYMKRYFVYIWNDYAGIGLALMWGLGITAVATAGILVDQLRLLLWNKGVAKFPWLRRHER